MMGFSSWFYIAAKFLELLVEGGRSIFTCCRKEWRGLPCSVLGMVSVAWLVATVEALVKSSWVGSVSFIAHRCSNIHIRYLVLA